MSGPILRTTAYLPYDYAKARIELIEELRSIKTALNRKATGEYYEQEVNTAQSLFGDPSNNKTIFRTTVDFGALPNATSKSVAHGISVDANTKFLKIFGAATDPNTAFIPLPFSSPTLNENIKVEVDGTNVTVTTAIDYTAFELSYVILEYVKF